MTTDDFATFVASQQAPDDIVWHEVLDDWLKALDSLHDQVIRFLQDYVPSSISYQFHEIDMTEPDIGKYQAKVMDIKIGRQHVSIVPVGTMLWGCRGRVEVRGSAGQAQILLVDARAKSAGDLLRVVVNAQGGGSTIPPQSPPISWVWKVLANTAQKTFEDLDKESFFRLLIEVANA
jgi:hypothetical protein